MVHQAPQEAGYRTSRWTLRDLRSACSWLRLTTESGLWRLLQSLDIVKKQGRLVLHSPDPNYRAKLDYVGQCWQEMLDNPDEIVIVYLDEFSYYRQPTLAAAYEARGHQQWRANLSQRSNIRCRGLGAVNAYTGQVHYTQSHIITLKVQIAFYQVITASYPHAKTIYVIQDNWPNHAHPSVLAHLEPQRTTFLPASASNGSSVEWTTAPDQAWPIQLVFLPTYAPWTNPIEKLWRLLRQDVLHLHRFSDRWEDLKQRVLDYMAQFAHGSTPLLHAIGLLPV